MEGKCDEQTALLKAFVKDHVPKVTRQFEHLLAKNRHASGYFVQDKVRRASRLRVELHVVCSATSQTPASPREPPPTTDRDRSLSNLTSQPTFAEFHLLYLIHALTHLTPTLLDSYPTLKAWNDVMWSREGLSRYKGSGRMKEMLNGNANGQKEIVCRG